MTADSTDSLAEPTSPPWWSQLYSGPWLWGLAATYGFYAAIPHLPAFRELAIRYFCSHPTEYFEVGLFFVAVVDLLQKLLRSRRERKAMQEVALPRVDGDPGRNSVEMAQGIVAHCATLPARLQRSEWGRRLRDMASFVINRHSADKLDDQLVTLAETAEDRLHDRYSLLNTVIWAIPIMGFLGTVLGITIAIAYITPEQLEDSLGEVTGGLAIAFDTTAIALVQSLILVFGQRSVRDQESRVLSSINGLAADTRNRLFPHSAVTGSPIHEAEVQAARDLVDRTETLIGEQTRLWTETLDSLRNRWTDTLQHQQAQLADDLTAGTGAAWSEHRASLESFQREFVTSYREVSRELAHRFTSLEESRIASEQALQERSESFWRRFQSEWTRAREEFETASVERAEQLAARVEAWQSQLAAATESATAQMQVLAAQSQQLASIVEKEEHLARLQQRLDENLDSLRAAEAFEQTLHSLNAAVHLLTARHSARAA